MTRTIRPNFSTVPRLLSWEQPRRLARDLVHAQSPQLFRCRFECHGSVSRNAYFGRLLGVADADKGTGGRVCHDNPGTPRGRDSMSLITIP